MALKEFVCSLSKRKNVYDLSWNDEGVKYNNVFHQAEKEFSAYNFEHATQIIYLKYLICLN